MTDLIYNTESIICSNLSLTVLLFVTISSLMNKKAIFFVATSCYAFVGTIAKLLCSAWDFYVEDTKDFIRGCLKGYAENQSLNTVILFNGEIVGTAGFNSIDWSNKTAYFGYWLGEEYQGKGIMTKVAKALTNYAFTHLNLNKVEIRAAVENKKSRSVPERLGFVNEGIIRQAEWLYDHYVDITVYGVLANEWRENNS